MSITVVFVSLCVSDSFFFVFFYYTPQPNQQPEIARVEFNADPCDDNQDNGVKGRNIVERDNMQLFEIGR